LLRVEPFDRAYRHGVLLKKWCTARSAVGALVTLPDITREVASDALLESADPADLPGRVSTGRHPTARRRAVRLAPPRSALSGGGSPAGAPHGVARSGPASHHAQPCHRTRRSRAAPSGACRSTCCASRATAPFAARHAPPDRSGGDSALLHDG